MANFKIYSASAGAGKTYQLVRDFLRICLGSGNPRQFMRILAITFTNKAANEMKVRIINQLKELANSKQQSPSMMNDLCQDLSLSAQEVRSRASQCLSSILHEYSAFSVSTIDGFTNRLIRSFAKDLQVGGNYEVEMENDEMLQEAVDELLANLSEKNDAAEIILRFVEEQLEEGRSPRPEYSLMLAGKNLFMEQAFTHLKALESYDPSDFKVLIERLSTRNAWIEKSVVDMAEDALELIHAHNLAAEHFKGRGGLVYTYFRNLADGRVDYWVPNNSVQKVVNGEDEFYAASKRREMQPLFAPIEHDLHDKLLRLVSFVEENYQEHHLISAVLSNIYGTAVITRIDKQLQEVKNNTNRLPIGEFNKLISEKLQSEPAEYLFERLGERYRYFFVDEFQDTSRLQWQNLLPLVNNAMASGGEIMLVGDAKQSIYRWRGGEVEQFLDLKNNIDSSNKVQSGEKLIALYERITHTLPKNYRSKATVVKFNNDFFSLAASKLEGVDFGDLYSVSSQEIHHEAGGYVEIDLLEYNRQNKEAYLEEQCRRCEAIIRDARARGYDNRDITILVRSNGKGSLIARYLLDREIPVISPDALALESSRPVKALVSGLEMINQLHEVSLRYYFLDYLSDLDTIRDQFPEKHRFIAEFCHLSPGSLNEKLKKLIPGMDLGELAILSLTDLIYELCRLLDIPIQNDPFLHAFLDQVRSFEIREGEDLPGFIRWWHERGHKINISTPDHSDAIQVMSIHKSKGLEFKVCILAFADWPTEREQGVTRKWLSLKHRPSLGIPSAWINLKNDKHGLADPEYVLLYERNKQLVSFDNINLLYVAFTRARDELYILSAEGYHDDKQRVFRYLRDFLDQHDADRHLAIGEKGKVQQDSDEDKSTPVFEEYESSRWRNKLMLVAEAPEQWTGGEITPEIARGKMIHGLLAEIDRKEDIEPVLVKHLQSGNLMTEEVSALREVLHQITEHPDLSASFQTDGQILNEADILIPGGKSVRPDRVVIRGKEVDIIDYKTGAERPSHVEQVNTYRNYLRDMGYPSGNNILAYVGAKINVRKWQSN
jgi:ATP-dependent exoDNAse (exonuclease V) beta subunit